MGSRKRPRALRLHEKLRQIREAYGLTQEEMVSRLGLTDELKQSDVSAFEREPDDKWSREPALPHLLRYARVAGLNVEVLIDDELELPDKLAPNPMNGVVRRASKKGSRSKKR
ncbi:MAG TPA: helix-turn-helix transcriptional regulator [Pyrinomonadaceae bacterium]|nr:helix-turn-helix transcriptional regulator [Pyrinomonadaceae bacterium]